MFRLFCRLFFKLKGWQFQGQLPSLNKYLVLVGPHTSNWDFVLGVASRLVLKTDIKFIGKKELFRFPFKNFFLRLGGIPVNRHKNERMVEAIARNFAEKEEFILAISPEGTRSKVAELRTGFYHIASLAKVPYVMVGFDYKSRKVVISEPVEIDAEVEKDCEKLVSFYAQITGKNPALGIGR